MQHAAGRLAFESERNVVSELACPTVLERSQLAESPSVKRIIKASLLLHDACLAAAAIVEARLGFRVSQREVGFDIYNVAMELPKQPVVGTIWIVLASPQLCGSLFPLQVHSFAVVKVLLYRQVGYQTR